MTNTNQQEQLYSRQDVINAWNSAYGGDRYLSGEQYVDDLLPTPPVEDGKQGGEVNEPELKMMRDDQAEKYAFQVPYNGTNDFYDDKKFKSFTDGWDACMKAISDIKSQPSTPVQDGWVSVEDGLPKEGRDVLVTDGFACMVMIYRKKEFNNYGKIDWWYNEDVTHWQPLPSPPVNKQD